MKRTSLFILALILVFAACKKSSTNTCTLTMGTPSTSEVASLQSYITSKSIPATQHPDGFFYQVVSTGYGNTPALTDSVDVTYKGTLTSGQVFDSTKAGTSIKFLLSDLILGWQKGIPLIKRGGEINLYLPPSLGYGCYPVGPIPANSNLIFNIHLL